MRWLLLLFSPLEANWRQTEANGGKEELSNWPRITQLEKSIAASLYPSVFLFLFCPNTACCTRVPSSHLWCTWVPLTSCCEEYTVCLDSGQALFKPTHPWGQHHRPGQQWHVHSGQCRDTAWNTSIRVVHFGVGTHISTHSLPAAAGVNSYKLCLELEVAASPHQSSCLEKFTNLLKTDSEKLVAALCHHVVVQLGGDVSMETLVKTPETQPPTWTAAQPHSFPSQASSLLVPSSLFSLNWPCLIPGATDKL